MARLNRRSRPDLVRALSAAVCRPAVIRDGVHGGVKFLMLLLMASMVTNGQELYKIEYNDTVLSVKKFSFESFQFQDFETLVTKDDSIFKVTPGSTPVFNDTIPKDAPYHRNWWDTQVDEDLIIRSTRIDSIVYFAYLEPDEPDPHFVYNLKTNELFKLYPSHFGVKHFDGSYFTFLKSGSSIDSFAVCINGQEIMSIARANLRFVVKPDACFLLADYPSDFQRRSSDNDSTLVYKFNPEGRTFSKLLTVTGNSHLALDSNYSIVTAFGESRLYERFITNTPLHDLYSITISNYDSLTQVESYPSPDTCLTDFYWHGKFIKLFTTTSSWPFYPALHKRGDHWFTTLFKNTSVSVFEGSELRFSETDNRWYTYYIIAR
jgi:hypothetical protein